MRVLVAIVAAGSFSGASRELRMPIASVSRKVSELERHLKAKLIVRSTRKLVLTSTGREFVAASKRILEDVAQAERSAAGEFSEPRGELVVTAPVVMGRRHLLPLVSEFLAAHREIRARLTLSDRSINLLDDRLDLALRVGVLPDSRLVALRVGEVRHVVCASPDYFKTHGTPRSPAELEDHDCITFVALTGTEEWSFGEQTVPVRSRLVVNTAEAAIDAALVGTGITRVLSYQVAEEVADKRLVLALQKFEPSSVPVHLVHTGGPAMPVKCRAFIDFVLPRLRERLADAARTMR
jgi:DNA-binding transcriptional LysR family regulator